MNFKYTSKLRIVNAVLILLAIIGNLYLLCQQYWDEVSYYYERGEVYYFNKLTDIPWEMFRKCFIIDGCVFLFILLQIVKAGWDDKKSKYGYYNMENTNSNAQKVATNLNDYNDNPMHMSKKYNITSVIGGIFKFILGFLLSGVLTFVVCLVGGVILGIFIAVISLGGLLFNYNGIFNFMDIIMWGAAIIFGIMGGIRYAVYDESPISLIKDLFF